MACLLYKLQIDLQQPIDMIPIPPIGPPLPDPPLVDIPVVQPIDNPTDE
jgi:hypothetical protein